MDLQKALYYAKLLKEIRPLRNFDNNELDSYSELYPIEIEAVACTIQGLINHDRKGKIENYVASMIEMAIEARAEDAQEDIILSKKDKWLDPKKYTIPKETPIIAYIDLQYHSDPNKFSIHTHEKLNFVTVVSFIENSLFDDLHSYYDQPYEYDKKCLIAWQPLPEYEKD